MLLRFVVVSLGIIFSFALPAIAEDIDCRTSAECPDAGHGCNCETAGDPSIVQVTEGPVGVGTQFKAEGGRASYEWAIDDGLIDKKTGVVIEEFPECLPSTTVRVTDACDHPEALIVQLPAGTALIITGPEDPVVGNSYVVSGGVAPFHWIFDAGNIDSNGVITAINECSVSGESRFGTITVNDSCGASSSIEVRLPGGVFIWQTTCSNSLAGFSLNDCNVWSNYQYSYDGIYEFRRMDANCTTPRGEDGHGCGYPPGAIHDARCYECEDPTCASRCWEVIWLVQNKNYVCP